MGVGYEHDGSSTFIQNNTKPCNALKYFSALRAPIRHQGSIGREHHVTIAEVLRVSGSVFIVKDTQRQRGRMEMAGVLKSVVRHIAPCIIVKHTSLLQSSTLLKPLIQFFTSVFGTEETEDPLNLRLEVTTTRVPLVGHNFR